MTDHLAEIASLQERIRELEGAVEQAFRDGIAYATNVKVKDADLAWEQSRARATLKGTKP